MNALSKRVTELEASQPKPRPVAGEAHSRLSDMLDRIAARKQAQTDADQAEARRWYREDWPSILTSFRDRFARERSNG